MLGVACGQIIFGPLSDHFGRLPVIRVGTLTYIAFSILSSLAWNIDYMWLARVAQGAAAASGAVIARALIRDRFEGDRAAQMMALTGAAMARVYRWSRQRSALTSQSSLGGALPLWLNQFSPCSFTLACHRSNLGVAVLVMTIKASLP